MESTSSEGNTPFQAQRSEVKGLVQVKPSISTEETYKQVDFNCAEDDDRHEQLSRGKAERRARQKCAIGTHTRDL